MERAEEADEGRGPGGHGGRKAWRSRMQKDTEEKEGQKWICSVISGTRMTEHKGILRSGLLLEIKLDLLYLTETSPPFSKARE